MKQMQEATWNLERESVGERLEAALTSLLDEDRHLFDVDANERSISFRLAYYLQREFPDCDIDCEYNRAGHDAKEVHVNADWEPVPPNDDTGKTVYPDVIVHQRGLVPKRNLLVVEMKKKGAGNTKIGRDVEKLRAYMTQDNLGYRFGALVLVETREGIQPEAYIRLLLPAPAQAAPAGA